MDLVELALPLALWRFFVNGRSYGATLFFGAL